MDRGRGGPGMGQQGGMRGGPGMGQQGGMHGGPGMGQQGGMHGGPGMGTPPDVDDMLRRMIEEVDREIQHLEQELTRF